MIKWLKCFFGGHEWKLISTSITEHWDHPNDRYPAKRRTTLTSRCQKCQKYKQDILKDKVNIHD